MSYLNVTNVSHTFGGRQILENVSFKLLRGEHVGLVGANGEGKATFLNTGAAKLRRQSLRSVEYFSRPVKLSARSCALLSMICTKQKNRCWNFTTRWLKLHLKK